VIDISPDGVQPGIASRVRSVIDELTVATKAQLRKRFGIWVVLETRNRVRFSLAVLRWRRFENREVARLRSVLCRRPSARVATIMPTYRRPELLLAAVRSALAQSVTDQVVIVVDDGGGLPELPDDERLFAVSLSRNSHVLGLVRNVGIRLSDSRYIAFLDDDNTWLPNHLEVALGALEAGSDVVYTAVERVRADGTRHDVLCRPFSRKTLTDAPLVDANSLVVRRDPGVVFSRIPRKRRTLPKEDWEFLYRLSRTRTVHCVPTPTVRYLINAESYYTNWATTPMDGD
jgi:hypothetical protein